MTVCVKKVAKGFIFVPLQKAHFDLSFPCIKGNTFFVPLAKYLVKESKINCKQQVKTVIWIVEIPVLSRLLCLAGDELSSKVQRKYPLFAFFSPAWG